MISKAEFDQGVCACQVKFHEVHPRLQAHIHQMSGRLQMLAAKRDEIHPYPFLVIAAFLNFFSSTQEALPCVRFTDFANAGNYMAWCTVVRLTSYLAHSWLPHGIC